ncbi:hypothetical protein RCH20_000509 [Psychrobacter sp. PL15]|uniref:hypothetical protein n=1 Tax=Psychrobacter sp. PL15 TaxID=3071719 RepID=UPI002E0AAD9A|nr:hypothetical protein [Psychrobacter sp. PL15]
MSYSPLSFTSKLFQLTSLTCALALAGCGGGDGDTVDSIAPPFDNSGPIQALNIGEVSVSDNSGNITRIITSSGATASVKVTDSRGQPVSSALVTFGTDAPVSSVKFGKTNGTVLTNADGIATMTLKAVSTSDSGSYSLSANANYDGVEVLSSDYFFSLQSANLIFDEVSLAQSTLPFGGSTDITGLVISSGNMEPQTGVPVSFVATCGSVGNVVTNILGFRATYDAGVCEGSQEIVATIAESGATIRLPVTIGKVTDLGKLDIQCISGDTPAFPDSSASGAGNDQCANNVVIGALGSTLPSVRSIEFVVSADDKPFANERVKVELLNAPNDFGMGSRGNQQTLTFTTDSAGRITVPLYAGNTIASNISVRATLISRVDVTATTTNIEVISSVPAQANFTVEPAKKVLAATETNPSTMDVRRLNDSTKLNVVARDANNSFVDGSTIRFIAEGGTLSANSCVVNKGRCNVTLSTAGVLPDDRRVTVLAYTTGTNTQEINGNGIFLDENESGDVNNNEFKLPSTAGIIFTQFVVGFADTTPTFTPSPLGTIVENSNGTSQKTFKMFGFNPQGNKKISMPSNTQVQVQALDKTTGDNASCKVQITSNGIVNNILTVPAFNPNQPKKVDLSTPDSRNVLGNNQDDTDKTYTIRSQNCSVGDEIKLIVTTPAPNRKTTTETLLVQ